MSEVDPVVWQLADGKPGHEKQSQALLEALAEIRPFRLRKISSSYLVSIVNCLHRTYHSTQIPDLVIGAGHKTHTYLLLTRFLLGSRSVVLMRPSLPASWFDMAFIPEHDRSRSFGNVVRTKGVLTAVNARDKDEGTGLILVGGESRHFHWDSESVADIISRIVSSNPGIHWQICNSRRTPRDFSGFLPPVVRSEYRDWKKESDDFLVNAMSSASQIWVTSDSVSMLYESLTSGARVGVIYLQPVKARSKLVRSVNSLIDQQSVQSSTVALSLNPLSEVSAFEPESKRCARLIAARFFAHSS